MTRSAKRLPLILAIVAWCVPTANFFAGARPGHARAAAQDAVEGRAGGTTLFYYDASVITWRMVSGDFDRDRKDDDIAAFFDPGSSTTHIDVWLTHDSRFDYEGGPNWWQSGSGTYSAANLHGRVMSGDFDQDGYKDDIAAFYDYGSHARIHVWTSTGSAFQYAGDAGWWQSAPGYSARFLTRRMVSGDFDRDGYEDDIAGFYDTGNFHTKLQVWTSTGSSFVYSGDAGWWQSSVGGYSAREVNGRVVSGDFDRDGYRDDVAAFYDYGESLTRIHVWTSRGSSFQYSGDRGWWEKGSTAYTADKIRGRVASGDFNRDGYEDDIAAFYDYGTFFPLQAREARIHMWISKKTFFAFTGEAGYWQSGNESYSVSAITGRILSGNFNGDTIDGKRDDVAGFHDDGAGKSRIHVWLSAGAAMQYEGPDGWWATGR